MRESYRCWAEVDLDALRANLAQIRSLAGPGKRLITVVKADAYGHGLRQIGAVLMQSGTDLFGVANLAEARALRTLGKGWPILMLGACLPSEIDLAVREEVMPTVSSYLEAAQFSAAAARQKKTAWVHLKVDTGMGRLGIRPEEAASAAQQIQRLPNLALKGLYTHYSSAEDDAVFTRAQRKSFGRVVKRVLAACPELEWIHASNSAGLLLESDDLCNAVRPGLLVYGIVPEGKRQRKQSQPFQPALSWKCRVSLVRDVPARTPISYGHTHLTRRPSRLATVTAGYGDGYLRAASNRGQVLIDGHRCPVLGRVTMDQMVVDVSKIPDVQAGAEVVLIGRQGQDQIRATELAHWSETIAWEVLTSITYRVPRLYLGEHAS